VNGETEPATRRPGAPAEAAEFLRMLATEFAHEIGQCDRLKAWTDNPALIGAHAEAVVRMFIARTVAPLRCLSGSIVWEERCKPDHEWPELDVMLAWTGPAPTLFEVGGFGLVPRDSCVGVLEVKRSTYSGSAEKVLEKQRALDGAFANLDGSTRQAQPKRFLGVYCIEDGPQSAESRLLKTGDAVSLLLKKEDGYEANARGIWELLRFLVTLRTRALLTSHSPNVELLKPRPPGVGADQSVSPSTNETTSTRLTPHQP